MARLKNIIPARYANFTIYVGEDDTEQPLCAFRVSRERLRFKSEIWEGKIQAALERGAPYCWFTEDNPDAIGIILNVIHGNPEANPYILNREVLFQVAESSARHGVVRALREFIRARSQVLLEGPEPNAENHARSNNFEQRIYISWIFGQRIPFAKAMTELINNMIISDDNYITMFPGLERIDLHYLPEGAAEQMALQAEARLIELKKVPETLLEELESGNLNHCAIKGSKAVEKCRRAMIGSLRIKMRVPESWPL